MAIEKTFRGISARLATEYLVGLGGRTVGDGVIEGEDWRATVTEGEPQQIGPTLTLTPIHVRFEGDDEDLEELVATFSQKAMRAGG